MNDYVDSRNICLLMYCTEIDCQNGSKRREHHRRSGSMEIFGRARVIFLKKQPRWFLKKYIILF
jgi:hypothetical protein